VETPPGGYEEGMKRVLALALVVLASVWPVLAAQTVNDPDGTYQLRVSDGWVVSQPHTRHSLVLTSTEHPGTQITIQYMPDTQVSADPQWIQKFRAQLERQMSGVKWGPQTQITIGGQPATRMDLEQGGCRMSFILLGAERRAWLFTVVATNPYGYDKVLEPVLNGVKLL
jgi:hypothetical protein